MRVGDNLLWNMNLKRDKGHPPFECEVLIHLNLNLDGHPCGGDVASMCHDEVVTPILTNL